MSSEQKALWGIDLLNVPRSDIPAVTHVDYSASIQTVHEDTNPRYYRLLKEFERQTGCGVLVNTSFNVRGEPIVCSPAGRLSLLHENRDGRAGAGELRPPEGSADSLLPSDSDWKKEFELD